MKSRFRVIRETDNIGRDIHVLFDVVTLDFESQKATVGMKISTFLDGKPLFTKTYEDSGNGQGGKMFWGGAFAMKNAIQQSTKAAVDDILRQYLGDLRHHLPVH